jgi:putative acetyltransferase
MIRYTTRKATTDDLFLSYEIRKNAMFEYISESKGWDEEYEIKNHKLDFNTDVMRIIEVDSKPAGVIESVVEDGNINVHGIYILKEFQNFKIGSRVMKEIIHTADAEKKSILLQVLKVNTKAKEFYEKHGFEIMNENENYFKMIYKPVE